VIIEIVYSTLWTGLSVLNGKLAEDGRSWLQMVPPFTAARPACHRSHPGSTGGEVAWRWWGSL